MASICIPNDMFNFNIIGIQNVRTIMYNMYKYIHYKFQI